MKEKRGKEAIILKDKIARDSIEFIYQAPPPPHNGFQLKTIAALEDILQLLSYLNVVVWFHF